MTNSALRMPFYADNEDYAALFNTVLGSGELIMYRTSVGPTDSDDRYTRDFPPNVSDFVKAARPGLAVCHANEELFCTKIARSDGSGYVTEYDGRLNPHSCRIRVGGEFRSGLLVQGMLDTFGETEQSRLMFRLVGKIVRKQGTRIGDVYVLAGALKKLREGWRLAPGPNSPQKYDLALNAE